VNHFQSDGGIKVVGVFSQKQGRRAGSNDFDKLPLPISVAGA
jgi:hypothetical protein